MINWAIVEYGEVGSTQQVARELAAAGAPEGTTVVARSQTSGVGRLGRRWVSPDGGLYMSFVLRPGAIPRPEAVTLVSAVAVAEGIERSTGLSPSIRWPNDILLGGRKVAGIIAEAHSLGHELLQAIVGVGVDCNMPASEMRPLEGEATTLQMELGRQADISDIRRSILDSFSSLYDRWKAGHDLQREWSERVSTLGRRVLVKLKTEENPFSCEARGLEGDGSLSVSYAGGQRIISPEDLEWLREQG